MCKCVWNLKESVKIIRCRFQFGIWYFHSVLHLVQLFLADIFLNLIRILSLLVFTFERLVSVVLRWPWMAVELSQLAGTGVRCHQNLAVALDRH